MILPVLLAVGTVFAASPRERRCDLHDEAMVETFNDGVTSLNAGNLPMARRQIDKALKRQPRCLMALALSGEVALREARIEGAAVLLEGMTLYPDEEEFPLIASRLMFVAQDFERSLELAQRARKINAGSVRALAAEILVLVRLGLYTEALASLDAAEQVSAHTRDCLRIDILRDEHQLGDKETLLASCQQSPDEDVRDNTLANLALAEFARTGEGEVGASTLVEATRAFNEERWADAARMYAELLDREGWNTFLKICLATCYLQIGQHERATPLLSDLFTAEAWVTIHAGGGMTGVITKGTELQLEESLKLSLATLVRVLVAQHRVEDAEVAQRKAEGRFGRVPELVASRITLEAAKDPTAAWATANAALASFPTSADVALAVGRLAFAHHEGLTAANLGLLAAAPVRDARYNVLVALSNAGRKAECVVFGRAGEAAMIAENDEAFGSMAYSCAASAGDLAALEHFYTADNKALSGDSVAEHARLLLAAARGAEAVLLARAALEREGGGSRALVVLGRVALEEGRVADVVAFARDARGDEYSRMSLAIDLFNAQKFAEVREVMKGWDCRTKQAIQKPCVELTAALKDAP